MCQGYVPLSVDYFYCYLNQMAKQASDSSYNLRIEKDLEYWLNYSDDQLVKIIEKTDKMSGKLFLKHSFLLTKLHVFLWFILAWSKSFRSKKTELYFTFI